MHERPEEHHLRTSQSLWVRDRFLMNEDLIAPPDDFVAIPLGQGQVFNDAEVARESLEASQSLWVRDRFLIASHRLTHYGGMSQSLWVRDRFLINRLQSGQHRTVVAIPLGQGQVFNSSSGRPLWLSCVAIPLGQGQVFNDI